MNSRSNQFVPGEMRCAKCGFRCHRVIINANTGQSGAGNNKTEPCPNGCGPLWPVTWEESAREAWELTEKMFDEIDELKKLVIRVSTGKQTADDVAQCFFLQEESNVREDAQNEV
jgi:hypothetical protein